ncbi:COX15/CtaA family protein [Sinomonas mesophila]|uniref:COX15/CtaA family protein n=1 Tax=Sinomonas mesophila TaxID=1531955 RepID=UPI0009860CC4|nr:COX15/CtaA family protein [Sinomonas mesophila]
MTATGHTPLSRLTARLPREVDRRIRALTIASLIGQTLLIGTGGAVRLTSSGLGCPTWPRCTAESLSATPEMGIHGVIEFGNRLLTFALAAVALAMLVMLWNLRKERKDLFWLAAALLGSIPAQAVIGGITVLTQLNPWVVGLHFLVSMALVVVAMLLVNRAFGRTGRFMDRTLPALPGAVFPAMAATAAAAAAAVVLGVVVTGAGPHAGDAEAPRNGLDWDLLSHIHAVPAYLVAFGALFGVWAAVRWRIHGPFRSGVLVLLVLTLLQAAIGITQYYTGIPPLLVGTHMVVAALLMASAVNVADLARHSPRL